MGHIINRLSKAKDVVDDESAMFMFDTWKKDISKKATQDARQEMKRELDTHDGIVGKLQAQLDSANAVRESAVLSNQPLELSNESLKGTVKGLEESLSSAKGDLKEARKIVKNNPLKSDLTDEQLKNEQLKLQVASLTGKLEEARKVKAPTIVKEKPFIPPPVQIPSFKMEPVRSADGKILSATFTPIRLN